MSTGGAVTIAWTPVPDATGYQVYGRTPGGLTQYLVRLRARLHRQRRARDAGCPARERHRLAGEEHLRIKKRAARQD